MKKFKNLTYLLLIFIISCDSKKETDGTTETLFIDMDKASTADFSDLFTKMEIVPLETTEESLIGSDIKFTYNEIEKCYFAFDSQQKIIFCFDENGQFKFSSAQLKGAGPGEYSMGEDFNYNPFDSSYEIIEMTGWINKYDKEMKFMKRLNYKPEINRVTSFVSLSKDIHALYYNSGGMSENGEDVLYFYSESEDTIKKTIHLKRLVNNINQTSVQPFTFTDNQVSLFPPYFSNTLYRIDLETLSLVPVLNVDYGKKTMTEGIAKNYDNYEALTKLYSSGYVFTWNILQNENMYFVISKDDQFFHITLYNKNSKKIRTVSSILSNDIQILNPFLLTNDVWYSCTFASNINSIIDMNYLTEESKLRLSQIQEDDNPVIVKYYLK
jgi:hypothetical protein